MRPLIINEEVRLKLSDLLHHAENNIFSLDDLWDIKNGDMPPPGDREGFSVELTFEYRVVFTIEGLPSGAYRHLSVFVHEKNRLPSIQAVSEIMKVLKFRDHLSMAYVSVEDLGDGYQAVNVQEPIFTVDG